MELEEDDSRKSKDEPWKDSVSYPSREELRGSFAEPGSFLEQQLRLDEIDDLVNERRYKRAKGLLEEMIPNHDINIAEHSFQLARCYKGLVNRKTADSYIYRALDEIRKAVMLFPENKRYEKFYGTVSGLLTTHRRVRQYRANKRIAKILFCTAAFMASVLAGATYYVHHTLNTKSEEAVRKESEVKERSKFHHISFFVPSEGLESVLVRKNSEFLKEFKPYESESSCLYYELHHPLSEKGRFLYEIESRYSSGEKKTEQIGLEIK